MKAKEYLRLNRDGLVIISALEEYLHNMCKKNYDWDQVNMYSVPLINSPRHKGHYISVTFNVPFRKIKYWVDGRDVEEVNYHGYSDAEMATTILSWNGYNFLSELEYFI